MSKHTDRLYKYSEAQDVRDAVDPRAQNEDLGDDPVRSSLLGIENLKRIVPQILQWTTTGEKGQTYEEASRLYYAVINQWNNYLYHVLANIGGIYIENTIVGDGVKTYTFVEKEKQQASLKFLMDEVLTLLLQNAHSNGSVHAAVQPNKNLILLFKCIKTQCSVHNILLYQRCAVRQACFPPYFLLCSTAKRSQRSFSGWPAWPFSKW